MFSIYLAIVPSSDCIHLEKISSSSCLIKIPVILKMAVMVVLLVFCQIVFCDSLRLKTLLQLNTSNYFITWCSFAIRYVLI